MDNGHVVIPECSAEFHARFGMNGTGKPEPEQRASLTDGFVIAAGGGFAGLQQVQTEDDAQRARLAEAAQADRNSRIAGGEVVW